MKTHWMVLVATLLLVVSGSVLMVSDKIVLIPWISPELAQWWPIVYGAVGVLQAVAMTLGDYFDDGVLNGSFRPDGQGGPYGPNAAPTEEQRRQFDEAAKRQRGHVLLEALGWIAATAFLMALCVGVIWCAFVCF